MNPIIKIGITGGIGSGKSIVSTLFELSGIPVYNADREGKRLTASSADIRNQLTELFGETLYHSNELDKKQLAALIFDNTENLQKVNGIIHPAVKQDFVDWINRQQASLCAIESAILFESGFDHLIDIPLMVYAPLEVRIQRVQKRDGAPREAVISRINSQLPDEEKKNRCPYVIYNDDRQPLIPQVEAFIRSIYPFSKPI